MDESRLLPNSPTIELTIGQSKIFIENHFSLNICEKFIEQSELGKDYRKAFINAIYEMSKYKFHDDIDEYNELTIEEFSKICEDELSRVLQSIIGQDEQLEKIYSEISEPDQYCKLYLALKEQFSQMAKSVAVSFGKCLEPLKEATKNLKLYDFSYLNRINDIIPKVKIPKLDFINANMLAIPNTFAQSQWSEINRMTSAFSNISIPSEIQLKQITEISKKAANITNIFRTQLFDITTKLSFMTKEVADAFAASMTPIYDVLATLDFERMYANKHIRECHKTLQKFGWWYISDFDEALIAQIHEDRESLTPQDVDMIICNYYRVNRCEKLKKMVKLWYGLYYFQDRRIDIQQLTVIHSRKYYNSSVTLLTIMVEGIVRDFIKSYLGIGFWKFSEVQKRLRTVAEDEEDLSLLEFQVIDHVLSCIDSIFNGTFDPVSPEDAPDYKRDKRLHGQALGVQSEADSLKLFLQINELFYLFNLIESKNVNLTCLK